MELIQLGDQANSDPQLIYFKLRLGRYPRRRQPTRSGFPHDFALPQEQLLCCPRSARYCVQFYVCPSHC